MAATRASAAELRPVPLAAPLAGAGFGLALLATVVADVPGTVRIAVLAVLVVAAAAMARELRRAALRRALAWDGQGGWTLDRSPVTVAPATRVYAGLVVLVLRHLPTSPACSSAGPQQPASARASVHWVPRHAVAPDAFRHLKAQLRHGRGAPAGERPENPPC